MFGVGRTRVWGWCEVELGLVEGRFGVGRSRFGVGSNQV